MPEARLGRSLSPGRCCPSNLHHTFRFEKDDAFLAGCLILVQATQEVVSRVPLCTASELNEAVSAAKEAFPKWRNTPVPMRARVMLKLQEFIRRDMVNALATTDGMPIMGGSM